MSALSRELFVLRQVSRLGRVILWTLTAGLTAVFAAFVWPTAYRYDHIQMLGETAPGPVYPVRINRFTGEAEMLLPEVLRDSRHQMRIPWVGAAGDPVPETVLEALRANVIIETDPLPYAQIMNSTAWRLTRLRWDVRSPGPQAEPVSRAFDQSVFIEPNSLASLYLDLGRFGREATISLEGAWGVQAPE
jgi:hypothetical protein